MKKLSDYDAVRKLLCNFCAMDSTWHGLKLVIIGGGGGGDGGDGGDDDDAEDGVASTGTP